MNNSPLFTIITVTFNAGKALEQTILSVVNQTCPHIEYIIVDGNSSDNTKDIIKQYESAISQQISESDAGLYDAINKNYVWLRNNAGSFFGHTQL